MTQWSSGDSLSPSILNLRQASASTTAGFSSNTLQPESGATLKIVSGVTMGAAAWIGTHAVVGGAPDAENAIVTIVADSTKSDYLYFYDSSLQHPAYQLGSHAGNTITGLNLFDSSASTMIVSFSKQSIRFFQPVVGPVFDTGGALSSTYNAALFDPGGSKESQIQAAINAASADGISRVYVPQALLPYNSSKISFIFPVRMVREGGDWTRFDVKAYGATGDGVTDDQVAFKGAAGGSSVSGGIVFMPAATYMVSKPIFWPQGTTILGDGRGVTVVKRIASSVTNGSANLSGAVFTTGPSDGTTYLVNSHGSYIAFQDFTIDGNADGISSLTSITNVNLACQGLRPYFMDYVRTERVEIRNCLESGMYMWGCRRSAHFGTVARLNGRVGVANDRNGYQITGPQDSLTTQGAQDEHIFIGCSAVSNTDEGLSGGQNGQIVVVGGIYRENGDHGIEGDSGTASSFVTSVPAGWVVSSTYVYGNGGSGIALANSNVQRMSVTGNVVENNGGHGIICTTQSGGIVSITGNTLLSNGTLLNTWHGITVNSGFSDVVISGNVLDGVGLSAGGGIVLTSQTSPRQVTITGNSIANYGTNGISVPGQATGIIANNSVVSLTAAFSDGILAFASTASLDNLDIANNTVLNTREYGFRLRSTGTWNLSNVRLRNNTATDNQPTKTQLYGLSIDTGNTGSILSIRIDNNDFSGNSTGAINNLQPAMLATGILDSTSSVSFGGALLIKSGAATSPGIGFSSENSLGFYRSAASIIYQTYGTFGASIISFTNGLNGLVELVVTNGNDMSHNVSGGSYNFDLGTVNFRNGNHNGSATGGIRVGDGTAAFPQVAFNSEASLGLWRSANSTLALSYGTMSFGNAYLASVKTATSVSSAVLGANAWAIANPAVSGASICININGVMYIFNSSSTTIGR